jgi:hypothetical protein
MTKHMWREVGIALGGGCAISGVFGLFVAWASGGLVGLGVHLIPVPTLYGAVTGVLLLTFLILVTLVAIAVKLFRE